MPPKSRLHKYGMSSRSHLFNGINLPTSLPLFLIDLNRSPNFITIPYNPCNVWYFQVIKVTARAEKEPPEAMLKRQVLKGIRPKTRAGDKGYDTRGLVATLRRRQITPYVAANTERRGGSVIEVRIKRHWSYEISQRIRNKTKEIFGWMKTIGGFRRTTVKGEIRTQLGSWFLPAEYNLLRLSKLLPADVGV